MQTNSCFADFDSIEDSLLGEKKIRRPLEFLLRVVNCSGALIRENCEIEGSRVVLLANIGTICKAFERKQTSSGIIRYKTSNGWLSEFRRDNQRDPIVEIIDLQGSNDRCFDDEGINNQMSSDPLGDCSNRQVAEVMTLRESVSHTFGRVHSSLRSVIISISRLLINDSISLRQRNSNSIAAIASPLSNSLAKIMKGIFFHPSIFLRKKDFPNCYNIFIEKECLQIKVDEEIESNKNTKSLDKNLNLFKNIKSNSSKNKVEEKSITVTENFDLNSAIICMYEGIVVKQILLPLLENRQGNINLFLLNSFSSNGVIGHLLDSLSFILSNLYDSIPQELKNINNDSKNLNISGRCALFALPQILKVVNKISNKENIVKSTSSNLQNTDLGIENNFQLTDLLYNIFSTIGCSLLPLFRNRLITHFPADIQDSWLNIIGEIVNSLNSPLPMPKINEKNERSDLDISSVGATVPTFGGFGTTPTTVGFGSFGHTTPTAPMTGFGQTSGRNVFSIESNTIPQQEPTVTSTLIMRGSASDETIIFQLIALGFARENILSAMTAIGTSSSYSNRLDTVIDYLNGNPVINNIDNNTINSIDSFDSPQSNAENLLSHGVDLSLEINQPENLVGNLSSNSDEDEDLLAALQMSMGGVSYSQSSVINVGSIQDSQEILIDQNNLLQNQAGVTSPISEIQPVDTILLETTSISEVSLSNVESNIQNIPVSIDNEIEQESIILNRRNSHSNVNPFSPASFVNGVDLISAKKNLKIDKVTNKDHYNKSENLHRLAYLFKENSILNVFDISNNLENISLWHSTDLDYSLIPKLCRFLNKINGDLPSASKIYEKLFSDLIKSISSHSKSTQQTHIDLNGSVYLILCLIRNDTIRTIIPKEYLIDSMKTLLHAVIDLLCNSMRTVDINCSPGYLTSAMLLLNDLISLPFLYPEIVMEKEKDLEKDILEDEQKEEIFLAEEKIDENVTKEDILNIEDKNNINFNKVISTLLLESSQFVSVELEFQVFDIIFSILNLTITKKEFINPDTCKSVFLLLSTLLKKQYIASKFVDMNGIDVILQIPSTLISNDTCSMLTSIVRCCMETSIELRQCYIKSIKSYFKDVSSEISIENFLVFAMPFLERSPDDFIYAVVETCQILNTNSNSSSHISVKQLNNDIINLNEKKYLQDFSEDLRANKVVSTLAKIFHSEIKNCNLFSVSDVLNSLSDCILSLERASYIITKVNITPVGLSFSDFLTNTYFSVNSKTNKNFCTELQSVCRFLVSLCTHKGPPRKMVIKTILTLLRMNSESHLLQGNDGITFEDNRILTLSRLSIIISAVIRSSSTKPKAPSAQYICVDTLYILVTSGVCDLLTTALSNIPLDHLSAADAINAIMDPLELMTRPKLLVYIEKKNSKNVIKDKENILVPQLTVPTSDSNNDLSNLNFETETIGIENVISDSCNLEEIDRDDYEYGDEIQLPDNDFQNQSTSADARSFLDNARDVLGQSNQDGQISNSNSSGPPPDRLRLFLNHLQEMESAEISDNILTEFLRHTGNVESFRMIRNSFFPNNAVMDSSGVTVSSESHHVNSELITSQSLFPGGIHAATNVPIVSQISHPLLIHADEVNYIDTEVSNNNNRTPLSLSPFGMSREMRISEFEEGFFAGDLAARMPLLPTNTNRSSGATRIQTIPSSRFENLFSMLAVDISPIIDNELISPEISNENMDIEVIPTPVPLIEIDVVENLSSNQDVLIEDNNVDSSQNSNELNLSSSIIESVISSFNNVDSNPTQVVTFENEINSQQIEDPTTVSLTTSLSSVTHPPISPSQETQIESIPVTFPAPFDSMQFDDVKNNINIQSTDENFQPNFAENNISSINNNDNSLYLTENIEENQYSALDETNVDLDFQSDPNLLPCPPGYDSDVFYSLPDFMQQEICDQHQLQNDESPDQLRELAEASGYDYDTLVSLPENIRQEILEQSQREQQQQQASANSTSSVAQEMDNASFLISLTPELRAEVLLTSEPVFLETLPPNLIAEAQVLRERAMSQYQHREMATNGADGEAFSFGDDEDEDDDDGENDDSDDTEVHADLDYFMGRNRLSSTTESQIEHKVLEGFMLVANDDLESSIVPSKLILVITKLINSSQISISSHILHKLIYNISKISTYRDSIIRIFTSLLVNNHEMVNDLASDLIKPSEGTTEIDMDNFHFSNPCDINLNSQIPSIVQNENKEGQIREISHQSSLRFVSVLSHIIALNPSAVYDMLRSRTDGDGEQTSLFPINEDTSNSLFETLIEMLSNENYCNNSSDLSSLTEFINIVCAPLDHLKDSNLEGNDIQEKVEQKYVQIPNIIICRDSLRALCDVLLNDYCSKKVFAFVTSSISRLTKVQKNNNNLTELIVEVTLDLSSQSHSRMLSFLTYLSQIEDSISLRNSSNYQVQLGEVGGRQHEKMLRVVQTLHTMTEKTGRIIADVTPIDQMDRLWIVLDSVLLKLRIYLADEDEKKSTSVQKPQSTLTAILSRLLPLIQIFFLINTNEILSKRKNHSSTSNISGNSTDINSSINLSDEVNSSSLSPSSLQRSPSSIQRQSAVPGEIYRTSSTYTRMNRNILEYVSSEDRPQLQLSRSLRSNISFSNSISGGMNISGSRSQKLLSFTNAHQKMLNQIINVRPELLEGSFSSFIRIVQMRPFLNFENKRKFFFSELKKKRQNRGQGLHLQLRRSQVFEDSFHQLRLRNAAEMRGKLRVSFHGEEGIDAGGLSREWFVVISREIFNPNYALFTAAIDGATFQPNPLSIINTNHLDYFKFVGRVIGKSIVDGQLMDAHFTRSFYKHVLGIPVDYTDIEALEPDYYRSLKHILDLPLESLGLDLTFSAENHTFGKLEVVDLIPNGRNIAVTDENKLDYVRLVSQHRMTTAIRSQIDSFLDGFYDLVSPELISIFSPTELELLICGLPDVDIEELRSTTEYRQYRENDQVIVWFWDVLRSFNRENRALFLQFGIIFTNIF
jgi:E3 ubiquitin-protein ligase HUWE1